MARTGDWFVLRAHGLLCNPKRELRYDSVPAAVCCRILVHGIDVSAAGSIRGSRAQRGNPYQAVSGGGVKHEGIILLATERAGRPLDSRRDASATVLRRVAACNFLLGR